MALLKLQVLYLIICQRTSVITILLIFFLLVHYQVRPCNNSEEVESYQLVLYRFYEQSSYHLSDIQLLSIVEDSVPAMAIALTSHHSTRWVNYCTY